MFIIHGENSNVHGPTKCPLQTLHNAKVLITYYDGATYSETQTGVEEVPTPMI